MSETTQTNVPSSVSKGPCMSEDWFASLCFESTM